MLHFGDWYRLCRTALCVQDSELLEYQGFQLLAFREFGYVGPLCASAALRIDFDADPSGAKHQIATIIEKG